MLAAVCEFHNQNPASSFPSPVSFPDVAVLVRCRAVTQTAAACADGFFNHRAGFACIALNHSRSRITGGENRQTLIAAEREFDRNRTARRGEVERWQIVNRLEEAGEVKDIAADLVIGAAISGVPGIVSCAARH